MNANPKFLAATAHVDDAAVKPLPNSRKIYVGPLRVPMREIAQSGGNPPLAVYDASGPYTDPAAKIDIRKGLFPFRLNWIEARGDTLLLDGPSSAYGRKRLEDPKLAELRFELHRKPRRGVRHADALREGDRHTGNGIHRRAGKSAAHFRPGDAARGPVVRRRDP